ncbi:MAG: hypothetical protein RLZZ269_1117 [Actinomycetota bacterium]|jgi:hypothetical protein
MLLNCYGPFGFLREPGPTTDIESTQFAPGDTTSGREKRERRAVSQIILLVVGAAWAAVLIPPLVRGRYENRPNSSVVDFRRQLSTLQRSTPVRGASPMRMARPLAQAPVRPVMARSAAAPTRSMRAPVRGMTRQQMIRQRRQNVVLTLTLVTLGSAFIAFTTKSDLFIYVFVLSAMSLVGYCYKLSQIRRFQSATQAYRRDWIRAA